MPKVFQEKPQLSEVEVGDCRLIHGDCRLALQSLPWHSVDLFLTDPPYGIGYKTNHRVVSETPDMIHGDEDLAILRETLPIMSGKLSRGGAIYCFCSCKNVDEVLPLIREAGLKIKNSLVWDKTNWSAGDLEAAYGNQYEIVVYAVKGDRKLNRRTGDIFRVPRVTAEGQIHPNQKPDKLLQMFIMNSTQRGELVVDPFMGSGSCGNACAKLGRRFIGCEMNERYYKSAVASIEYTYSRLGAK